MAGPKFNFKIRHFTLYTALITNVDLFVSGQTQTIYNDVSNEKNTEFKVAAMKSGDVSINSSLQIGADYRLTEHLKIGLSAEAYFAHLNNMMDKNGPYFFNFSGNGSKIYSTMLFCGTKIGYSF